MSDTPDVLKRLEEIEALHTHTCNPGCLCDTGWLLRLTRALLASQGELAECVVMYHDERAQRHSTERRRSCVICVMLARAEAIRKGELP